MSILYINNTYIYKIVIPVICMKSSKLFTLNTEIVERLSKVVNASALVNQLLEKHFDSQALEDEDEIIDRISKYEIIIKEKTASIEALNRKLERVKSITHKTKTGLVMRMG